MFDDYKYYPSEWGEWTPLDWDEAYDDEYAPAYDDFPNFDPTDFDNGDEGDDWSTFLCDRCQDTGIVKMYDSVEYWGASITMESREYCECAMGFELWVKENPEEAASAAMELWMDQEE